MSLGHCQVTFSHEKAGNKDLVVSLYQAIALLLFNAEDSLTTLQIQQMTGMDADDTARTLLSLSLGKVKILKKTPHVKQVLPEDTWSLNASFTHPQRRIVVNSIQATESPQEVTQTRERVFEDRAFAVDAAIVRIMKTKKKLSFRSLVADVFEMVKFPMEVFICSYPTFESFHSLTLFIVACRFEKENRELGGEGLFRARCERSDYLHLLGINFLIWHL